MHYTCTGLIVKINTSEAPSMPCLSDASDAAFQAIDWSPRDILIPYELLAVSVGCAAHGSLFEE